MIQIREIDHLVLRVINLETMLRFYRDVLGCKIERAQEELGLTQLRAGRSLIDMVTVDGKLGLLGGKPPGAEDEIWIIFVFASSLLMPNQFTRI